MATIRGHVNHAEVRHWPDGSTHNMFICELVHVESMSTWTVEKRFTEFAELNRVIRRLFPYYEFAPFPRRTMMRSYQSHHLESRRQQLDAFLQSLFRFPEVSRRHEVLYFLQSTTLPPRSAIEPSNREEPEADVDEILDSVSDLDETDDSTAESFREPEPHSQAAVANDLPATKTDSELKAKYREEEGDSTHEPDKQSPEDRPRKRMAANPVPPITIPSKESHSFLSMMPHLSMGKIKSTAGNLARAVMNRRAGLGGSAAVEEAANDGAGGMKRTKSLPTGLNMLGGESG